MYNLLQSAVSIKNDNSCHYDMPYGFNSIFPQNGKVEGWDIYSGVYLYGAWNKVLFGFSKEKTCYIGRTDNILPFSADDYNKFKLMLKITAPVNNYCSFPTQGKLQWITTNDNTWDDSKSVLFDLKETDSWTQYSTNLSELQFWSGLITNFRITPFVDGYSDIQFAIKFVRIESDNIFQCLNTQCSYYTEYVHPCQGIGAFGAVQAEENMTHYTTVSGINDSLMVNIDNYGAEKINLGTHTNITGQEMARVLTNKLSLIDIGGYVYSYTEHTEDNKLKIHSGNLGLADEFSLFPIDGMHSLYIRAYSFFGSSEYFDEFNLVIGNPFPYIYIISGTLEEIAKWLFINEFSVPVDLQEIIEYKNIFVGIREVITSSVFNIYQLKLKDPSSGTSGVTTITTDVQTDIIIVASMNNFGGEYTPNYLKDVTNDRILLNNQTINMFDDNPSSFETNFRQLEIMLSFGDIKILMVTLGEDPGFSTTFSANLSEKIIVSESTIKFTDSYIKTLYPYSGFYTPSTVVIEGGTAIDPLGFTDKIYSYGVKPATGFEFASSRRLRSFEVTKLIDGKENDIAYFHSPDQNVVEAGRKKFFESMTANGEATSSSRDFYKKIEGANYIIIDASHPINNCGRLNNIKVSGKKYDNITPSVMIFRPLKDGTIVKLYEIEFETDNSDAIYTIKDSTYFITVNWLVSKGDIVGFKNFGILCLHASSTMLPNALLYRVSASINIDVPFDPGSLFSQGIIGPSYYAYSDRIQDSMKLIIDIGKRTNVGSVDIYGKEYGGLFEYNVAACLDVSWKCDTYGETHWHSAVSSNGTGYTWEHLNLPYGLDSLGNGVVTVDGGKEGDSYTHDSNGLGTSGEHSYFYVNGDAEWLTGIGDKYEISYPYGSVRIYDYEYDPLSLYMVFPDNRSIPIYKSTIYFKESSNFKHMSLSYYEGPNYGEGNAEDIGYNYIESFNTIKLDGVEYYPIGKDYVDDATYGETITSSTYIFPNPMPTTKLNYVDGEATNWGLYQAALNTEWNIMEHNFDPVDCYGFKIYCDWHKSTKIVEIELYSYFEVKPTLVDNFIIKSSVYGEFWDDITFNEDLLDTTKIYANIYNSPRYFKLDVSPQTSFELYSIRFGLSENRLKLLDCANTLKAEDAPKGRISKIQSIEVENTYDNPLSLFVDIPKQLILSENIISCIKLSSEETTSFAEIGPGAVIEKNDDYYLELYKSQIAINCQSYYLNNLIDGKQSYIMEDEITWSSYNSLTHGQEINYYNHKDRFKTNISFNTVSSRYFKITFSDIEFHSLFTALLYYEGTLVPINKVYIQAQSRNLGDVKIPISVGTGGILEPAIVVEDYFDNSMFMDYWDYSIPIGNGLTEDVNGLYANTILSGTNSFLERSLDSSINSFELEIIVDLNTLFDSFVDLTDPAYAIGTFYTTYIAGGFDNNLISTSVYTTWYSNTDPYIGQHFPDPTIINEYRLYPFNYDDRNDDPKAWLFEASNDDITWVTLDSRSGEFFVLGNWKTYSFQNEDYYTYYRLNILETLDPVLYNIRLQEIEFGYTETPSIDDNMVSVILKDDSGESLLILEIEGDGGFLEVRLYSPNLTWETNPTSYNRFIQEFYFYCEESNTLEYIKSIGNLIKISIKKEYIYLNSIIITTPDESIVLYNNIDSYTYFLSRVSVIKLMCSNTNINKDSIDTKGIVVKHISLKALPIISNYEAIVFDIGNSSPLNEIELVLDNKRLHHTAIYISNTDSDDYLIWTRNFYRFISSITNRTIYASGFDYSIYVSDPPWDAFNNDLWRHNCTSLPQWLVYDYGKGNEKIITQIYCHFISDTDVTKSPTVLQIYGSNDGSIDWETKPKTLLLAYTIDYSTETDFKDYLLLNNYNSYRQYCFYFPDYVGAHPTDIRVSVSSVYLYEEMINNNNLITYIASSGGDINYYTDGNLLIYSSVSVGDYLTINLGSHLIVSGINILQYSYTHISTLKMIYIEYSINSTDGTDGDWFFLSDLGDLEMPEISTGVTKWWYKSLYFQNPTAASWVRLIPQYSIAYTIEMELIIGNISSPMGMLFSYYNNYFAIDLGHVYHLDFLRNYGNSNDLFYLPDGEVDFSSTDIADPQLVNWGNSDIDEARWIKISLLNGDDVDKHLQYIGIYPDTSFAYRKYGGFNCDWTSIGNLLSRYNYSYNLAPLGTIMYAEEGEIFTAKSIVLDFATNWGHTYTGIRSIDFFLGGELLSIISTDLTGHCTVTTDAPSVAYVFDINRPKIGYFSGSSWRSVGATNHRIIGVFNTPIYFDKMIVNNWHSEGYWSDIGVKDTKVYISNEEITSVVYGETIISGTLIFDGFISQHIAEDIIEDQTLYFGIQTNLVEELYYMDWGPLNCISGDASLIGFENCWAFKRVLATNPEFTIELNSTEYVDVFKITHSSDNYDIEPWMNEDYIIYGKEKDTDSFSELFNITGNSESERTHSLESPVLVKFIKLEIIVFTKPVYPIRIYNEHTDSYIYLDGGFVREFEVWLDGGKDIINSELHPVVCTNLQDSYTISAHELIIKKFIIDENIEWDNSEEFFKYSDNITEDPNQVSFVDSVGLQVMFAYNDELLNSQGDTSMRIEDTLYLSTGYYFLDWDSYGATTEAALFISIGGPQSVAIYSEGISSGWLVQNSSFSIVEDGYYNITINAVTDNMLIWGFRNFSISRSSSNSSWILAKRNTATGYSWDNDSTKFGIDYLDGLKVFAEERFAPTEVSWWWSSTISTISNDPINTKVGKQSLRIDYPTSSGVDRLDFIEGDHLGWDEDWSIKDSLCFWFYISDLYNLYTDEGGFGFGSFDGAERELFVDRIGNEKEFTPKIAIYTWDFRHMNLKTGWNYIKLNFDKNTTTCPITSNTTNLLEKELNFRESYFTSLGMVYKGKGQPFYMLLDGFTIKRNYFDDEVVNGQNGLCLTWKEYAEIPIGGLNLRKGSIEFWTKFYTTTAGMDSFGDIRSRTLFTIVNNNNEMISLSLRSSGWLEVGFGGARYNYTSMWADPNLYDLSSVSFVKDDVAHIALTWSNDATSMTNNETMRLYINNVLVISSTTPWSVSDSKSSVLRLGGGNTILANNNDQDGSAIFSNIKVYDYCKDTYDINSLEAKESSKLNHNSLLQVSKDSINFYDINSGELPLKYDEVLPGEKVTIYTRVDKTNIDLVDKKTGTIDIEWEVIV